MTPPHLPNSLVSYDLNKKMVQKKSDENILQWYN